MKIRDVLKYGVWQWLYWVLFFMIFKLLFLCFNFAAYSALPWADILGAVLHGLRMDASAAGYLTIFPAVCLIAAPWFPKAVRKIILVYGYVVLPVLVLMGCTDMALFSDWQTRLDIGIVTFLKEPAGVAQSLSAAQWIAAIVVYAVLLALAIMAYKKAVPDMLPANEKAQKIKASVVQLLCAGMLIVPIRGTTGNAPMNPSTVSFSKHIVANYGAYNYFWNFVFTALNRSDNTNPLNYMTEDEAGRIFSERFTASQQTFSPAPLQSDTGVNVVFILLESFSSHLMGALTPDATDYCPCLSRLCREGIAFDRFYASGNRSDKGVSAALAAYPSLVQYTSILGEPSKLATLKSMPALFADAGYATHFVYGGDIDFYNTKLFLLQSGVERITERGDFPLSVQRMQKWGAPDEYLYGRYAVELDTLRQPFFSVCYNISSHPPFDIPSSFQRYPGSDSKSVVANSMAYADSCLGVFVDNLRRSELWDRSLVVVTSDHTASLHEFGIGIDEPENYRIPLVLTGGVVDTAYVCHNVCGQTDLLATVAALCGIDYKSEAAVSPFTKDVFEQDNQYAFFFRNELWGYVSPEYSFVVNIETGERRLWYGTAERNDSIEHNAEAYARHVIDDYLQR